MKLEEENPFEPEVAFKGNKAAGEAKGEIASESVFPDLSQTANDEKASYGPFLICLAGLLILVTVRSVYAFLEQIAVRYLSDGYFWELFESSSTRHADLWQFMLAQTIYLMVRIGVFAWLILLFFKRKRKFADIFINTQVLFILVDILFFMMGVVNFDIRIDRYFPITTIFDFIFLAIVGNYLTKSKKGKAVFIN
jgi:hypothetical protein